MCLAAPWTADRMAPAESRTLTAGTCPLLSGSDGPSRASDELMPRRYDTSLRYIGEAVGYATSAADCGELEGGGAMTDDAITRTAYCPNCDAEQAVRLTVPWQADLCTVCGESIAE